jgi:hypothetical protein
VFASARVARRAADPRAAANGIALVGLGVALASVAVVRAWFSPPFFDVPPPHWMVVAMNASQPQ